MDLIKPRASFSKKLDEILHFRTLIYFLALRNIKVKYRQTFIGILWTVIQPLVLMAVFVFFFSKTLALSTDNIPPPLFYLYGLILWNFFSSSVSNSSASIVQNATLIKRIYFPRLILPLSNILMAVFDFCINYVLLLIITICYINFFGLEIKLLPLMINTLLGLGITSLAAVGIGLAISSLSVFFRDFIFLIPFGLQFLFFSSPIIYASSAIENSSLSKLIAINPLVGAIELGRSSLSGNLQSDQILISLISGILILLVGLAIYFRTEKYFADVI